MVYNPYCFGAFCCLLLSDAKVTTYRSASLSSFGFTVRGSGDSSFSVSARTNPQVFYYRFASVPLTRSDMTHWSFKAISPVFGPAGTVIGIDVTWAYSNHYKRQKYSHRWENHHKITIGPVYDGVAGGSPDDKITHVSKPYLYIDPGVHG